ncbi:MAG: caspase family protein [Pyrinomonadaceae bacterium]|nr:caspase family protein [Pyrinomonadaceae bacterium]
MKTESINFRLGTIALLLLVLALFTAPVQAQNDRGVGLKPTETVRQLPNKAKRYAIVIGVDRYDDTQITTLGGAVNDAKTLANALVQYAGFPGDQVTLLASDQPVERQPTRGNILRRLSNLAAVIPKDGLLLLAFAGHGIERGGQAFLLPSDAQVSNDVDLLEQTAINVKQIKEKIQKTGVGQVLMILDACRNDPVGRANADNPLTPAYTRGFNFDVRNREVTAFATLYATAVGARAYEYKERKQGYFTWELVEALKGKAANERGEVTLAGLVKYLQDNVPKRVLLDLGAGKDQRPFAVVEGYKADELVLAVANPNSRSVNNAQPEPVVIGNGAGAEPVAASNSLEGTTWTGNSPEAGEYTIEFLKGGQINYIIKVMQNGVTAPRTVKGTWKQSGASVQIVIGNSYSVLQGTVDGAVMKGQGTNQEGTEWKWTLFKKQ